MSIKLKPHQLEALEKMHNGCILCGGVGSGKSITSLAYYYLQSGGDARSLTGGKYSQIKGVVKDLYVITTAKKRDSLDWDQEMSPFGLSKYPELSLYRNVVVVDSWNNIKKYTEVKDAFFIFDEQRVVGSGVWAKSFIHITKSNEWILLSATPGDTWLDYIPVFVANGFYRNASEFKREHVIYKPFRTYPEIDRYVNTRRLERLRDRVLVDMEFQRDTVPHHKDVFVEYNRDLYRRVTKERWNVFDDEPIQNASSFCMVLRRVVNSDDSRAAAVLEIMEDHPKAIIFYNFDYELEILLGLQYPFSTEIAQWNSHKHQEVPTGDRWVYLVQYNAGNEGWNCITTDTIIFYSENHSYRMMTQAAGRIDRMNTRFVDLWYYHLKSTSSIDRGISLSLKKKKDFNKSRFAREYGVGNNVEVKRYG